MLQSLPPSPLILLKPAHWWLIVRITKELWRDLDPTPLTLGERGGVLLQDLQGPNAFDWSDSWGHSRSEMILGTWERGRGTGMHPLGNWCWRPVGCAPYDWPVTSSSQSTVLSHAWVIGVPSSIPLWITLPSLERGSAIWVSLFMLPPCPFIVGPVPLLTSHTVLILSGTTDKRVHYDLL